MTALSKFLLSAGLVAGAAGFTLPAFAQDSSDPETIVVPAPRYHFEGDRRTGVPEKVSLSVEVRYDDLDLRSRHDAYTLRTRIRDAAQDVCSQLADAYPFYQMHGTSCYRTALESGLIRANEAIRDARDYDE